VGSSFEVSEQFFPGFFLLSLCRHVHGGFVSFWPALSPGRSYGLFLDLDPPSFQSTFLPVRPSQLLTKIRILVSPVPAVADFLPLCQFFFPFRLSFCVSLFRLSDGSGFVIRHLQMAARFVHCRIKPSRASPALRSSHRRRPLADRRSPVSEANTLVYSRTLLIRFCSPHVKHACTGFLFSRCSHSAWKMTPFFSAPCF